MAVVPQLGVTASDRDGVGLTRLPMARRTVLAFRSGAAGHPAVAAPGAALRDAVPPEPAGSRAAG
ncbi:hypothetical protein [Streptomyces sp. NPDC054838]